MTIQSPPILFANIFLSTTFSVHAQATFSIGPLIGGSLSTVHFEQMDNDYPKSSYRPGWSVGVVGEIGFGHWELQPAVLYNQYGFKSQTLYNNGTNTYDNRDDVRLQYLSIPLHVAYRQRVTGQGVQVFAGPYLGLLLGGHYQSSSTNVKTGYRISEASAPISADPNSSPLPGLVLQRFDAGLDGGFGYRYRGFLLQAEYHLGLRNLDVDGSPGLISFGFVHYQNRAIQASLTYLFGAKNKE